MWISRVKINLKYKISITGIYKFIVNFCAEIVKIVKPKYHFFLNVQTRFKGDNCDVTIKSDF